MKWFILVAVFLIGSVHAETMRASWYHEGRFVATGARYNPDGLTCAHRTLPFGTKLRVTYKGRSVDVLVNDRGPALWTHRELDLSRGAARVIGLLGVGVDNVSVDRVY